MFLGLRTVIHPAPDLDAAKTIFPRVLGVEPYFDEPFYVGFRVAGYELGLDPSANPTAGPAKVHIPGGGMFGIIENPHFQIAPVEASGPGR